MKISYLIPMVIAILLIHIDNATANMWTTVENIHGMRTEIDNEATVFMEKNRISLAWRIFLASTKTYLAHKGTLDCEDFSLRTESIDYLVLDELSQSYKSRLINLNRSTNAFMEMYDTINFPAYGGDWNKTLRTLCGNRVKNWDYLRSLQFPELRNHVCKSGDEITNIYCDPRNDVRGALVNMRTRRLQHQRACHSTEDKILIAESPIFEAKCHEENCRIEIIDRVSRLYGSDLAIQGFGKPCSLVEHNFDKNVEERKKHVEFSQYWSCVRAKVSYFDDRTSSADVISQGLHSACRSVLSNDIYLSSELKQSLIQVVLEERSHRRKK